jgi:hypothetical protein
MVYENISGTKLLKLHGLIVAVAILLFLSLTAGCGNIAITSQTTVNTTVPRTKTALATNSMSVTEGDQAAIYAAAIRQIYTKDDSHGGKLQPSTLYIRNYTDDTAGNGQLKESYSELIGETVQSDVLAALSDLPTELIWIVRWDGNRPYVALGNIYPQPDGTVQVAASIYVANLGAQGQVYILKPEGSGWKISGNTGYFWQA